MDWHALMAEPAVKELLELDAMTLATAGPDGSPHAAPVYFAAGENGDLVFFSDPGSLHSQHLAQRPQAAAAIHPQGVGWQEIHGLQLHGTIRELARGMDWEHAWQTYARKFPFVAGLKPIVARNSLYAFRTTWLRLVDNRQGFGTKQEWRLE